MLTLKDQNYMQGFDGFLNVAIKKSHEHGKMNHEQYQTEMLELIKDVYFSAQHVPQPMFNRLARLLAAVPAPKGKAMTKWQWLGLAVPKKDIRQCLLSIGVRNHVAYGCDSHRIHAIPRTLADGLYFPKVESVRLPDHEQLQYPNVEIVSDFTDAQDIEFKIDKTELSEYKAVGIMVYIHDCFFRKKYIDDAVKIGTVRRARLCKQRRALRLDFDNGAFAVVMGLRE